MRTRAQSVAAAALWAQGFTAYVLVMRAVAPASAAQWQRADPILRILPRELSLWLVPALGFAAAGVWLARARPTRAVLVRAARDGALGALLAVAIAGALRLVAGPHLPAFVPAEESAAPGYLLGMTAGYGEEIVFRLAMLPLLYLALAPRLPRAAAVAVSVLATGLAFALLHQAGPGPAPASYFVTRLLIPGAAMSLAFLLVSPSLVVVGHCAAHLLIPALFI